MVERNRAIFLFFALEAHCQQCNLQSESISRVKCFSLFWLHSSMLDFKTMGLKC